MKTQPDLHIHDARADEREAIRALTLAAYAEYADVMMPTAWAGLEHAVRTALDAEGPGVERIVAERDGALVGSVMLFSPEVNVYGDARAGASWPELRLLAVDSRARGGGVGKALIDACVQRVRAAGAPALGLHTSQSLRVAIHIYEQMGFQRVPAYDFQPEGAELVMAYRLDLRRP